MSKARAQKIKLVLFDVDGVLTDGKIWLFPAPAGAQQSTQAAARGKADAGGYNHHEVVATFASAFPMDKPRYVVVVMLDHVVVDRERRIGEPESRGE